MSANNHNPAMKIDDNTDPPFVDLSDFQLKPKQKKKSKSSLQQLNAASASQSTK